MNRIRIEYFNLILRIILIIMVIIIIILVLLIFLVKYSKIINKILVNLLHFIYLNPYIYQLMNIYFCFLISSKIHNYTIEIQINK